jgi:hypothetical protein
MPANIPTTVLDEQLALLEGDVVQICSSEPTNYTEATVTFNLASQAVTGGDFTYAAGDVSGRKWTCAPTLGTTITTGGTSGHVAITNSVGTTLRFVTTCNAVVLLGGGTVDISPFITEQEQLA